MIVSHQSFLYYFRTKGEKENLNPMKNVPLVHAFRGSVCENVHFASTVVCSKTGDIRQMFPGSGEYRVFLRSAAKPFQAFPLYQNLDAKNIPLEEWAVICASHAASQQQLTLVQKVLDRAGVGPEALQCGPHAPADEAMAKMLLCSDMKPTAIHNNCSGKHAGMLLACRLYGWPMETYLEPSHPLQQQILKTIEAYSGTSDIEIGVDGCGAPVFALPLKNIARLFSHLAYLPEFSTLREAMTTYPEIVGDPERIDTQLMKISNGNLIAKVGAEGCLGVGNLQTGEGLAVKMHDGNNEIRDRMMIAILEDLKWLDSEQTQFLWAQPRFSKERSNTQGRSVGHFEMTLPWSLS